MEKLATSGGRASRVMLRHEVRIHGLAILAFPKSASGRGKSRRYL